MEAGEERARAQGRSRHQAREPRKIAHDQVKYHGHPLYYYIGDHKAGQATGEGLFAFKGFWYTVTAKGRIG